MLEPFRAAHNKRTAGEFRPLATHLSLEESFVLYSASFYAWRALRQERIRYA